MRKIFIYAMWGFVFLCIAAVAIVFTAIAKGKIGYVPPVEELENPNLKFATQVISEDGKLLGTWSLSKENRVYVGYEDLSPIWYMPWWPLKMCVLKTIPVSTPVPSCVRLSSVESSCRNMPVEVVPLPSSWPSSSIHRQRQCNGASVAETYRVGDCGKTGTLLYKGRNSYHVS